MSLPRRGRRLCRFCRKHYVRQYRRGRRVVRERTCGRPRCQKARRDWFKSPLNRMMRSLARDIVRPSSLLKLFEAGPAVKASPSGRYIETAQYFTLPPGLAIRDEGTFVPPEGEPPPYP